MSMRLVPTRQQPRRRPRPWGRIALTLLSLPVIVLTASSAFAKARGHGRDTAASRGHRRVASARELQKVADDIGRRLGIARAVTVSLVERNPYLVSVEAPGDQDGAFVVLVEEQMLELLSADELEAVLAHELGHVWIFTHHPYLQTELLANQVAMRTVSREALARVYAKVWKGGAKGDLLTFLGNADPQ